MNKTITIASWPEWQSEFPDDANDDGDADNSPIWPDHYPIAHRDESPVPESLISICQISIT